MRKQTLTIIALALGALFLIAGAAMAGENCPYSGQKCPHEASMTQAKMACGDKATTATTTAAIEGEKEITLKVSNMTCNGCVNHVTKSLAAVDGVKDVTVSLDKGTAVVKYDMTKTKPEFLTAAVVKAGYPAEMADVTTADAGMKANCDPAACAKKGCDPSQCPMKTASTTEAAKTTASDKTDN